MDAKDGKQSRTAIFTRAPGTRLWMTLSLLVVSAILIWKAYNVILLLLASVLMALMVGGLSTWLCHRTRFSYRATLTFVILTLLALLVGLGFLLAPQLVEQASQLQTTLPRALEHLRQQLSRYDWGQKIIGYLQSTGAQPAAEKAVPAAAVALNSILTAVGGLLVLVFAGLYLAADPRRYVEGTVRLLAPPKRERAKEVLRALGITLQRWLVGRLVLMVINAIATSIGLWALQIPMALTLGILSGLLNFIPNFGPIIAAIPAIMVAFLQGPEKALYVLIFYVIYQNIDGYILEPQVEKRTVSLPPAATILVQVLLGLLFGAMGVLLAAPIAAITLVLVKMLYLEDVLGERVQLPSRA